MIEIEGKILTTEILTERFRCDLSLCKGMCCVDGNSGAPLEAGEAEVLEAEYEAYRRYMTPEGIEAVERQGFAIVDEDGDLTTPLVGDAQCAYSFEENGITLCAIEKAFKAGQTEFVKPISCHLYPIRIKRFRDGSVGLNYHRWSVCNHIGKNPDMGCGAGYGEPLYITLKTPIIRAFGEQFYDALHDAAKLFS